MYQMDIFHGKTFLNVIWMFMTQIVYQGNFNLFQLNIFIWFHFTNYLSWSCLRETNILKVSCLFYINRQRGHTTSEAVFREMVNDPVLQRTIPNMFHLLLLSLLIPSSTAAVAWSFSLMNGLSTPLRNRLHY